MNSTVPGERHWIGFIVATVLMVVGAAVSFVLVRRWTATRSR